jgi:hypothetical protein
MCICVEHIYWYLYWTQNVLNKPTKSFIQTLFTYSNHAILHLNNCHVFKQCSSNKSPMLCCLQNVAKMSCLLVAVIFDYIYSAQHATERAIRHAGCRAWTLQSLPPRKASRLRNVTSCNRFLNFQPQTQD